ncbi:MAG TPA: metallophosphoesterase [Actinomycetota bacterium]|nr:metallophosphoesterase [Actinomycetota bacterium]
MLKKLAALVLVAIAGAACASTSSDGTSTVRDFHIDRRMHHPAASPSPGDVLMRFAAIGDWGSGTSEEDAVAARMCRWRRHHPFDLVMTAGDNIYDVGAPADFDEKFYRPMSCLLDDGVRFHASLGNHDIVTNDGRGEINEPRFGMKARNYVLRDSGVRFVFVDSNALDRQWLRRAVTAAAGDLWTIVLFHHPVYSPGTGHGSTPGFRPSLPRLFRRKGVDLVVTGHDHIYSVTKPLHRIRYVVTGGGGASLYGCSDKWFSDRCVAAHHFLYVVVRADRIVVQAVPSRGDPFDRFSTAGRS